MSAEGLLESDADSEDEYNAIIEVDKGLASKKKIQDGWMVIDSLDDNTEEEANEQ